MAIRVFVLDDHVMVRDAMCLLLRTEPEVEVVGHAESGEVALPMLRKLRPEKLVRRRRQRFLRLGQWAE